ncbi:MAG TPA: hypothetical protein VN673_05940, partial [Clostridia bacterium]|nr:hypothetical protein [Clostridia bacterium]
PLPSAPCLLPSPGTCTRADASRENGRKSRGPVTPEGKARSSQNALKHGLSSQQIVIGTEDEEEWLEFEDECRQALKPVGAIELGYADEFAASRWRLRRCLGIETSIFDDELASQESYVRNHSQLDPVVKTGRAFRSAQDSLNSLGRYETRIRRSGERALANLLKLQSMRQKEPVRCGADAPVCEPAPQPVQPSASSAAFLQNEPNDLSEPTPAQASPAAVNRKNEPNRSTTWKGGAEGAADVVPKNAADRT